MKVSPLLFAALLLATLPLCADEAAPAPGRPEATAADPSISTPQGPAFPIPTIGLDPKAAPAPADTAPAQPQATSPAAPAPAPGKPDPTMDLVPAQPGQLLPEPTLVPENPNRTLPPPGTGSTPAAPTKTSKTEQAEQDLALLIRFRQAKTIALQDAAVQAEWHNSLIARTDLQKREAMQKYYKLLYARITKLDPTVTSLVTAQQLIAVRHATQFRVAPTKPLSAAETARRGPIEHPFTPDQF